MMEMPPRASNRKIVYKCTSCDKDKRKIDLVAKRVQFMQMGFAGKALRSRVIAWLCHDCIEKDPDYNRAPYKQSPGMADLTDKAS